MTNDSTELTFVRCPSCRSLVPAVSTRCRMCGSSLGGAGDAEETQSESSESSRVRKNTTSTEGAAPVVDQIRQDVENAREALDSRRRLDEEEEELSDDSDEVALDDFDDEEEGFDDPLGEFIEEVDFDDDADDDEEDLVNDDDDEEFEETPAPHQMERPVVRVESGGGKRAGGLSFGGDKGLKKKEPAPQKVQPKAPESGPTNGFNGHDRKSDLTPEKMIAREDAPSMQQKEKPREEKPPVAEMKSEQEPQKSKASVAQPAKQVAAQSGRLCGWLVSYSTNEDGEAIELREGKIFVSGSKLKETDLVIEDASVSTPHAILSLDSTSFMIQDLMSDQGVFVKRRSEDAYKREEEKTSISHGDWIRFGDVEFLVTLIASVGK